MVKQTTRVKKSSFTYVKYLLFSGITLKSFITKSFTCENPEKRKEKLIR